MLSDTPDNLEPSVKVGPEIGPNADALTSLTRGRGPRRGNLEDLLKYWRPIMRKPGGFRRCVVILMDKPQFGGKPQRICAWLHHELTGKWPNEGNHHGRGKGKGKRKRRGKLKRRVRSAARRAKSANFSQNDYSGSALRQAVRDSRDSGGILTQPIAGRQNVVEMKAALFLHYSSMTQGAGLDDEVKSLEAEMEIKRVGAFGSNSRFGQAAQAAGSTLLPGNISPARSPIRSSIYRTLTPGGGSGRGRRLAGAAGRVAGRTGRGARNRFRCPPGFVNGGTFTDRRFSTCGALVLRIPGSGPGSLSASVRRSLTRLARQAVQAQNVGDRRNRAVPSSQIIANSVISTTPKAVSANARDASVNTIINAIPGDESIDLRVAKRDGVILEPVDLRFFATQTSDFDDVVDGSIVVALRDADLRSDKAVEAAQTLNAGPRSVFLAIPDAGILKFSRVGGELSPAERSSLTRSLPTSIRREANLPDPSAGWRSFVERSAGKFALEFGNLDEDGKFKIDDRDNELVQVQGPGNRNLTVPMWVYETFLSRSAPRRAKNDPIFELVPEGKSVNPFFVTAKADRLGTEFLDYQQSIARKVDVFNDQSYLGEINFKRTRPGGVALGRALGGFASALAFFDPTVSRYRCPPGFTGGGQLTNVRGSTCGRSLSSSVMSSLGKLQDARGEWRRGRSRESLGALRGTDMPEEGSFRESVLTVQSEFEDIVDSFDAVASRLPDVNQLDGLSPVNVGQLSDDERRALQNIGSEIDRVLRGARSALEVDASWDRPTWDAMAESLQNIATIEARRAAYLDFYGLADPDFGPEGSVESNIEGFASYLAGQGAGALTSVDDVVEESLDAVTVGERERERAEDLVQLDADGGLWDVEDMVDAADLFLTADDVGDDLFGPAVESQIDKYIDKVQSDPDSFTVEELGFLAAGVLRVSALVDPEGRRWDDYQKLSEVYRQRVASEVQELDVPVADRSDEALISLVLQSGLQPSEALDEYKRRLVLRVTDKLRGEVDEAWLLDADTQRLIGDEFTTGLRRYNPGAQFASMLNWDDDAAVANVTRGMRDFGLTMSSSDLGNFKRAFVEVSSGMQESLNAYRLSENLKSEAEDLDNLYAAYLSAGRDAGELVTNMSHWDYSEAVKTVQRLIDSLYGVEGAEDTLSAMVTLKKQMRDRRAAVDMEVRGAVDYLGEDPDILPGPNVITAYRNRMKGSAQMIVSHGLRDLTPEDYDVSRPGEAPYDTIKRLHTDGELLEWSKKVLEASTKEDAKDRSKRTILASFDVRTDDDELLRVEVDNVVDSEPSQYYDPDSDTALVLSSQFYVTFYNQDGDEVHRHLVSPNMPNITRTINILPNGSYSVEHDYVVVNDRWAPNAPFRVPLPDGRDLSLDLRRRGLSDELNSRYIGMAVAAGLKENHGLEAGWEGTYVWPKKGIRSENTDKIKAIHDLFTSMVRSYDSARESMKRDDGLSHSEIGALLIFNGDDRLRDRVAQLINHNMDLGDDDSSVIRNNWAQHAEFIYALNPSSPEHEEHVKNLFMDNFLTWDDSEADDVARQLRSVLPEGSLSAAADTSISVRLPDMVRYYNRSSLQDDNFKMMNGNLDLAGADINEIGC